MPHLSVSPWLEKDINVLEKVQERALKRISGLKSTSYSERLKELKLYSLKERRQRADMVEVFKIMNGHSSVNKETWFETVETNGPQTRNRSDPLNLKTKSFRSDVRKNFFSQRVVPLWNQLPNSVKSAPSITAFKSRYDTNYHT